MRSARDEQKNRLRVKEDAMKKTKKRKVEMRRVYDFSGGERGKFFHPPASQRMIPLDTDIIRYFQRRAQKEKKLIMY
ncbi:MAG: hypothetical protein ONB44_10665 [candidate division KSB1 bacterium]|nr:hypothetical protein [candidate division KSB1 bacterium]MDZ7302586.1 hypothetical protein [candidate division KSB1 bacterium]MDZ7311573.1 hypothetical protein [candidate division KSB1 bacterium]